jgi:CheY-like chemotaxis protein
MSWLDWLKRNQTYSSDAPPVRAEILVVEDDAEQLEFMVGLLRMQGAIVTTAMSIASALEAISRPTRYQLAFVDLNLQNSSGVEVVRRIKGSKRGTHCVVVSADFDKIQLCLEGGYTGVLLKPYSISSIREVLRAHRLPTSD